MPKLSALEELSDYIAQVGDDEMIGHIMEPTRHRNTSRRFASSQSDSDSNLPHLNEFLGRLKQIEVSRRRQYRQLRRNFNNDYDSNLIDLCDASNGGNNDSPPPPPPPYLFEQTIVSTSHMIEDDLTRSFTHHSPVNEGDTVPLASIDSSLFRGSDYFSASTKSPLVQSESALTAAFLDGRNRDLILAIGRRRRVRNEKEMILMLGLNIEDADTIYNEAVR